MNTQEQWIALLEQETEKPFTGWDFSYIKDQYHEEPTSWRYRQKVEDFLKPNTRLLDMGTGGGEFLLSLRHPHALISATESWEPNFLLCQKRLAPLGITVKHWEQSQPLPFADNSFDLVLNRHEFYDLQEVHRVLAPGGFFITQQVGGRNNEDLIRMLLPETRHEFSAFNLENQVPAFQKAGFRVMYKNQSYKKSIFTDVGAVCFYVQQLPWEFPDFSPRHCIGGLLRARQVLEQRGKLEFLCHRFIIIGKKR